MVYFDGHDGSRKRQKFETRKAAAAFLTDKEVEYENLGKNVTAQLDDTLKLDAHRAAGWLRALCLIFFLSE